jgi:hypothetical protein
MYILESLQIHIQILSIIFILIGEMVDHGDPPKQKPDCVIAYNQHMGGVDRCDQMVSYAAFERRTLKWWKKIIFHLVGLAVLNSYILYKLKTARPVLQRIFRRDLARQLIESGDVTAPGQRGRKRTVALVSQRLTERHFPSRIPPTEKRQHPTRKCVVCGPGETSIHRANHRANHPGEPVPRRLGHESSFECLQCQQCLCIIPCFEIYHTKSDVVMAYKQTKIAEE